MLDQFCDWHHSHWLIRTTPWPANQEHVEVEDRGCFSIGLHEHSSYQLHCALLHHRTAQMHNGWRKTIICGQCVQHGGCFLQKIQILLPSPHQHGQSFPKHDDPNLCFRFREKQYLHELRRHRMGDQLESIPHCQQNGIAKLSTSPR